MNAPIVIVGGGFGGLYTALALASRPGHPPVLLVEPRDRFVFLPFLYERLSGELPLWQMAPRYVDLLAGHGIGWVQDRVLRVDPATSHVELGNGQRLQYSRLVLGCGARPDSFGIPGVREHALGFHNLKDVERLRQLVMQLRQRQQPLQRLAVVGAGPSGVELACKLADLLEGSATVELIERGPQCLPQAKAFNRAQAELALQRRDVRLRCHCAVTALEQGTVTLKLESSSQPERLAVEAVIWTAGQQGQPPAGSLPLDQRNRLQCTDTMQLQGMPEIFALGDGATVPHDPALPATAQVAFQQAPVLADNLLRSLQGQELQPFQWNDLGEMLSLGVGEACLTGMGLTLAGPSAQQLRRWIYLTRLPGKRLPLQVAAGWLSDWPMAAMGVDKR